MDTKYYLSQIGRLDQQIQNKLEEIHRLRIMSDGISALNDSEKVQTSGNKDKISSVVSKIVDMEREVDKMIDKRSVIVEQIEKMENDSYYDMLINVFVLQKDLKAIAVEKKHTYRHVQRLRDSAVKEFERLYGKIYLEMS